MQMQYTQIFADVDFYVSCLDYLLDLQVGQVRFTAIKLVIQIANCLLYVVVTASLACV